MKTLVILDSNLREEGSINFATDTLATVIQEPLHEQEKRLPEKAVGHHEKTQNMSRRPSSAIGTVYSNSCKKNSLGQVRLLYSEFQSFMI